MTARFRAQKLAVARRDQAVDGEDEQAEQAVGLGVGVLGEPGVHRPRLDHGAARRGQPAEPRAQGLPAGGTGAGLGRADVGGGLQRPADRVGVGGRVQRAQPVDVEVHPGAEVVALPAVDEDAGVERLAPLDPGHDPQHGVLEASPSSSLGDPLRRRRPEPGRPVLPARRTASPAAAGLGRGDHAGQPRVARGQPGEQLVDVPRAGRVGGAARRPRATRRAPGPARRRAARG